MKNRTKAKILGTLMMMSVLTGCPQPNEPGTNIEIPDNPNNPNNPDNPDQPGLTETLPALTVGEVAATITKDAQNTNVLNVVITLPDGTTAATQIALTDGTNFTFAGKTFNFNITFASGVYDEDTVNAITGKFTAKGASEGTTITTPAKPQEPPAPQPATLKIDGVEISIPVPAEGVNVIDVSAVVSNGAVADFDDPSGILAGKTVNLTLGAPDGQDRINYSAISAIETAFKANGATPLSNTAGGVIPVFEVSRGNDSIMALIDSKGVTAQNSEVKIVNGITARYEGGNKILEVSTPVQLAGSINCSELTKIRTTAGNIYADNTLRLSENNREVTLADFLAAYEKCGFDLDGENNFLPKPGNISINTGSELSLDITDTASSWNIYKLYERYHDKGKLSSLTGLHAQNITVAGENASGLYDADSQPSASFPYKVDGEIIDFMLGFHGFENLYCNGDIGDPASTSTIIFKNFAAKGHVYQKVQASGACFFEYVDENIYSTGALKIMNPPSKLVNLSAKYLDLSAIDDNMDYISNLYSDHNTYEIFFKSISTAPQTAIDRSILNYDTGYYVDDGVTKLIPTGSQYYASNQTNSIYGVLELQSWTMGNPPRDKSAIQQPLIVVEPYANQNPALDLIMGCPALAAILDDRLRGRQRS